MRQDSYLVSIRFTPLSHTLSVIMVLVMFSSGLCPSSLTVTAGVAPDLPPRVYITSGAGAGQESSAAGPASLASHGITEKIIENIQ